MYVYLKEDKRIGVEFTWDEGEFYWINPLTSEPCERIEQALSGWSEQSAEENEKWDILRERISELENTYPNTLPAACLAWKAEFAIL